MRRRPAERRRRDERRARSARRGEQQDEVQGVGGGVPALHVLGDARVHHPEAADEREADVVAEELGPLLAQRRQHTNALVGNGDLEHQERDRDREDTVREGVETVEREAVHVSL